MATLLEIAQQLFNQQQSEAQVSPFMPPNTQVPAQAPVAAPTVQPLPTQPMPVQAPVAQPMPAQMPQQPMVQKMAQNVEGIDQGSKESLAASGAREQKVINDQINYTKEKAAAEKTASQDFESKYGTKAGRAEEQVLQQQQLQDKIRVEMENVDSQVEKLKANQFKDFWADKSTGQKVAASIAVALGSIGQSLTGGGQNVGMVMLQRAMDDDFKIQEANFNKAVKQIELSKLSIDQKTKMIDNLEKQRLVYNAAQGDAVLDAGERYMRDKNLGMTPQAQEVMMKLQLTGEQAKQNLIMKQANKVQEQYAVQTSSVKNEDWLKEASNEKSTLGSYNKAMRDYNKVQSFKKSGNYNAAVIDLIASGLQQGSYNPDNFDATTRSIAQKIKDKGLSAIGEGEKSAIVQSAEKFFSEQAKERYNSVKDVLPRARQAELQGMGQGSIAERFPTSLENSMKDLGTSGLKKLQ